MELVRDDLGLNTDSLVKVPMGRVKVESSDVIKFDSASPSRICFNA